MNNTHVCSRCKKLAIKSTSIHKTLAYARCRCHRLLKKEDCSTELKSDNPTNSQYVLSSSSRFSSATQSTIQSQSTPIKSDLSVTFPPIDKRHSVVGDLSATADYSDKCSDLDTEVTKVNSKSPTLEKLLPDLQPLSRPKVANHQKLKALTCTCRSGISQLADIFQFIPTSKKSELRQLFQHCDTDGDGHLSLMEFMDCLPNLHTQQKAIEFIEQLYTRLSTETYFGIKEFTLGYCIAEVLSHHSFSRNGLKCNCRMKDLMDTLPSFMSILMNKSSKDGLVSITAVEEAVQAISIVDIHHSVKVLPSVLCDIALNGQLHLLQCLSFSSYYLCLCQN